MSGVNLPTRLAVFALCIGGGLLLQNHSFKTQWLSWMDSRYKSPRPNMTYTQLASVKRGRDSGERLANSYYAGLSYEQGLAFGKPVVLLTQTPGCAANDHAAQLVSEIRPQFEDRFTFVTLNPQGMALSVPPEDPLNKLLLACHTSVCVASGATRFVLAFDTLPQTQSSDLAFALNDYAQRNSRF